MPWVKKKGLYLPDSTSYAESVNAFQDDFTTPGYLYISMGFSLPEVNPPGTYIWLTPLNKRVSNDSYKIAVLIYGDAYTYENAKIQFEWGDGTTVITPGAVVPRRGYKIVQCVLQVGAGGGITINGAAYKGLADTTTISDPVSNLKISGMPIDGYPIFVDHLVIGTTPPPWFIADAWGGAKWASTTPELLGQPFLVDLHWAMLEGLVDPTQFLHFYTFQELDNNGNVPDYGSNPQPLALYGNAQLAEAYEVEPQFNPTIVYDVHALRLEAKVRPFRMKANLRREG